MIDLEPLDDDGKTIVVRTVIASVLLGHQRAGARAAAAGEAKGPTNAAA